MVLDTPLFLVYFFWHCFLRVRVCGNFFCMCVSLCACCCVLSEYTVIPPNENPGPNLASFIVTKYYNKICSTSIYLVHDRKTIMTGCVVTQETTWEPMILLFHRRLTGTYLVLCAYSSL